LATSAEKLIYIYTDRSRETHARKRWAPEFSSIYVFFSMAIKLFGNLDGHDETDEIRAGVFD
jgi:hypothetical protein